MDPKEIFLAVMYAFEAVTLTVLVISSLTKPNSSDTSHTSFDLNVDIDIGKNKGALK